MSKPILLYSNFCSFCEKFFIILEKTGLTEDFIKISVDKKNGVRPAIISKMGIKEVPSLVIDNKVISGKAAFQWLKKIVEQESQNTPEPRGVQPWGGNGVSNGSFLSGSNDNFLVLGNETDTRIVTPDNDQAVIKTNSFAMVSDRLIEDHPSDTKQTTNSLEKDYAKCLEMRDIK